MLPFNSGFLNWRVSFIKAKRADQRVFVETMVYLAPLWRHPGILMEAGPRRYGHQWYNNTWYSFLHWQKYNFEHYGALQGQFVLYLVSQGDKMVQLQSRKYVEVSWLLPPDTISPSWALPHTCVLEPYHSTFSVSNISVLWKQFWISLISSMSCQMCVYVVQYLKLGGK